MYLNVASMNSDEWGKELLRIWDVNLQDLLKPWEKRRRLRNEVGPDPKLSGTVVMEEHCSSQVLSWYGVKVKYKSDPKGSQPTVHSLLYLGGHLSISIALCSFIGLKRFLVFTAQLLQDVPLFAHTTITQWTTWHEQDLAKWYSWNLLDVQAHESMPYNSRMTSALLEPMCCHLRQHEVILSAPCPSKRLAGPVSTLLVHCCGMLREETLLTSAGNQGTLEAWEFASFWI